MNHCISSWRLTSLSRWLCAEQVILIAYIGVFCLLAIFSEICDCFDKINVLHNMFALLVGVF